jgi:hypothetical protein
MILETERRKARCDPHHTTCDARPLGDRSDDLGETRSDVEAEAESKARLRLELFERRCHAGSGLATSLVAR